MSILNYVATSNHIHLVVVDNGNRGIAKSIQLVAGRTGQEYNQRKKRNGAFWQDRYHATAIEDGHHLRRCLVYVDLNMVRAGVVKHPRQWMFGGYNEIMQPRRKCGLIDHSKLMHLCGHDSYESFADRYEAWVMATMSGAKLQRESQWSQSLAVGSASYVYRIKAQMGHKAIGRKIQSTNPGYALREAVEGYNALFGAKKCDIGPKNTYLWNE